MTITLPRWARAAIYIVTIVVTPLVAYLRARDIIGDLEVQLWAAEVAAAGTVATLNLSPKVEEARPAPTLAEQRAVLEAIDRQVGKRFVVHNMVVTDGPPVGPNEQDRQRTLPDDE